MAHHHFLLSLLVLPLGAAAIASIDTEDPLIHQVVGGGGDNDLELNTEHHFVSFVCWFGKSYHDANEHAYRMSVQGQPP
jgi:cathepsin F